jgi:hypothetical protein
MGGLGHSTPAMAIRYQPIAQDPDAEIASRLSAMVAYGRTHPDRTPERRWSGCMTQKIKAAPGRAALSRPADCATFRAGAGS